jgi:hypothetical protein
MICPPVNAMHQASMPQTRTTALHACVQETLAHAEWPSVSMHMPWQYGTAHRGLI